MSDCRSLATLPAIVLTLASAPALSQDDETDAADTSAADSIVIDRTPQSCIAMSRIRRTEVLDDRTVLFVSRTGSGYVNLLETNCPTLKLNGLFRYRVNSGIRTARLCDSQAITVIDRLTNGLTYNCRLGPFHPVSEEQVQVLLNPQIGATDGLTPIEVPPHDAPGEAQGSDE